MKPKTALQKQVAGLSATLRPITAKQEEWAYRNCVEHFAYRTKSGMENPERTDPVRQVLIDPLKLF